MRRRQFMTLASVALPPAVAGCSDDGFDPIEPVERLGTAASIALDAEPERDYEYDESTDMVTTDSGVEMPFDEWETRRAAVHASDAVTGTLDEASVLVDGVSTGTGEGSLESLTEWEGENRPTEAEFDRAVEISPVVVHRHQYDRDGDLISKSEIPFERIVEETPRSADVTMLFPERDYRAVLPVICRRMWIRNE